MDRGDRALDDRWMEEVIRAAITARGGYAFRSDLLDVGLTDRDIRQGVRSGLLVRLRHGTYAFTSHVGSLSPEHRHRLVAYSVIDKLGPNAVLSHQSAAIVYGCPTYDVDLDTVHVTKLDRKGGRNEAGVEFHVGTVQDDDLCLVDGRQVVTPARAVIESCSLSSVESGMVTASFALRSGACTVAELVERQELHQRWPGMLNVRLSLAQAEPSCESVGEVRSFYMFRVTGLPRPEPQVEIWRNGVLVARSDFGWSAWWHVGEFDGLIKYGRLNPYASHELGQVLIDEKNREDQIREQPLGMSRWIWFDLDPRRRTATADRIRVGLERSRRVYGHDRVHIPLA